jgi:hypothetical protein
MMQRRMIGLVNGESEGKRKEATVAHILHIYPGLGYIGVLPRYRHVTLNSRYFTKHPAN